MVHTVKIKPEHFEAILAGRKKHEIRRNDRGYNPGDTLIMKEWKLVGQDRCEFTGKQVTAKVTHMDKISIGTVDEYVIMSIKPEGVPA